MNEDLDAMKIRQRQSRLHERQGEGHLEPSFSFRAANALGKPAEEEEIVVVVVVEKGERRWWSSGHVRARVHSSLAEYI
jgi:hypothetical protein